MIAIITNSQKEYMSWIKDNGLNPEEYLFVNCCKVLIGRTFEDYGFLDKHVDIPLKEMTKINEYLNLWKNHIQHKR